MERILLFDGKCAACSPLARAVEQLKVPGLTARSLDADEIVGRLTAAGVAVPDEPALLCDDGAQLRVLTGNRMRLHLARLLGVRRAREIARLAMMEAAARRKRASSGRSMGRRRVLGAAAGTVAGMAVLGAARPAQAAPSTSGITPASPEAVQALLSEAKVKEAIASFGAVEIDKAIQFNGTDEPIVSFHHPGADVTTFVGVAPGKKPMVLSMRTRPAGKELEYLSVSGQSLAIVSLADGRPVVRQAETQRNFPSPADVACFYICLGAEFTSDCVNTCFDCATGGLFTRAVKCPICAICAGNQGIQCARRCF